MILSNIIHYYIFLFLVSIPPLITKFRIVIWVISSSFSWLSNSWMSPYPYTSKLIPVFNFHMIFLDLFQVSPMLNLNICWNFVKVPSLCIFKNFFPIFLLIPLDWFNSEFPRTFYSCIFLHTISVCSIIKLNFFVVTFTIDFWKCWSSHRIFEGNVKLDVQCSLSITSLQLSANILSFWPCVIRL